MGRLVLLPMRRVSSAPTAKPATAAAACLGGPRTSSQSVRGYPGNAAYFTAAGSA